MSLQLLYSRIIASAYGITITVWAALIGITLTGLALGYFAGGYFSRKKSSIKKTLIMVVVFASILTFLLPITGQYFISTFLQMSTIPGLFLFCVTFILPIVFFYGMVSPLVIENCSSIKPSEKKGSKAGLIYAISTFGGITGTFIFGLYFIPYSGIQMSMILISSTLLLSAVPVFIKR